MLTKEKIELKRLRTKIYNKQSELFKLMSEKNITDYSDPLIQNNIGEINILEEIFECKYSEYEYEREQYWK